MKNEWNYVFDVLRPAPFCDFAFFAASFCRSAITMYTMCLWQIVHFDMNRIVIEFVKNHKPGMCIYIYIYMF